MDLHASVVGFHGNANALVRIHSILVHQTQPTSRSPSETAVTSSTAACSRSFHAKAPADSVAEVEMSYNRSSAPGRCACATNLNMELLYTILIGLIVGAVAKLLMPGKDPGGWIITIVLGIAGALVATYAGQALNWYRVGEPAGFIGSVIGAMLLLLIYRLIARPRRHV